MTSSSPPGSSSSSGPFGLAILVGILAFEEITEYSCAKKYHLNVYLMVAIALFALTLANLAVLGSSSAKGAIWDPRAKRKRRWVVPMVYINIVLSLGEFAWALVGSIWVVNGLMSTCIKPGDIKITDVPLYMIMAIVITTWIGLGLKFLLSCFSYNTIEGCGERPQANNETLVMAPRKSLLSRIFGFCCKTSTSNVFQDVATVLSDVFDDPNFVPTDIAAALILLYARQNARDESEGPERPRGISIRSSNTQFRLDASGDSPESSNVSWDDALFVKVFMEYAGAAYGYTWFLMRNTSFHLFKMYPYMKCFACCSCCHEQGLIEADNCLQCNTAALRAMLPHLEQEDIVHISFKNKLMEVPYFVAADRRHKKIVVSIRGTLSLEDALTDLCATPGSMGDFDPNLEGYLAHTGMIKAANYVYKELMDKHLLDQALSHFDGYDLVITGHSLGAGTAVIPGFHATQGFP